MGGQPLGPLPAACEDLPPSSQAIRAISGAAGAEVSFRPLLRVQCPAQGAPTVDIQRSMQAEM